MFFPFLPLIIIIFPFVELYLFFRWIDTSPLIALIYMTVMMLVGGVCIKFAKVGFAEFLRQARTHAVNSRAIVLFGKLWIIGVLLFFPGYLTDIIAVAVWLFASVAKNAAPPSSPSPPPPKTPAENNIVEVESHFVDEPDEPHERP